MKLPSTIMSIAAAAVLLATPATAATRGTFDSDGVLRFPYGTATPPVMSCSIDNVCEIILQPGEKIFNRVVGDSVRWTIDVGVAGPGGNTPTLYFKPSDTCNRDAQTGRCHGPLQTNMIITGQQHNYEIVLKSDSYAKQTRYGYVYPREDAYQPSGSGSLGMVKMAAQASAEAAEDSAMKPPAMTTILASITCDNYRIVGKTPYAPVRVCNDGLRTYVQIPTNAPSPTFQLQASNGDYSLPTVHPPTNGIYTLDGVPDHIVMIGDVGPKVAHVDIFHNGAK